ncbi:hypothetical protein Misp06_00565 [Microbulbifer sp. NBRC 101763]|uniref:hypothetical protein n=1 Tax=Microbulbifer TaxID=48073 RepID=UPI00037B5BC4|nr:hypothetical protein [Microbulbifer variabilis]
MFELGVNISLTLLFGWSLIWVFLAWGLGVANFAQAHDKFVSWLGYCVWGLLILLHFYAIYALWMNLFPAYWMVIILFISHLLFGFVFGRNLSAR